MKSKSLLPNKQKLPSKCGFLRNAKKVLRPRKFSPDAHPEWSDAHAEWSDAHTEWSDAHTEQSDIHTEWSDANAEWSDAHTEQSGAYEEQSDAHAERKFIGLSRKTNYPRLALNNRIKAYV